MKFKFRKIEILSTLTLLVLFSSCVTTQTLSIEIPEKAKKELPNNIQSLLIINRTVDGSYTNLDSDSLQRLFYKQSFNYDTIVNDTQSADTMIKALGELLYESGRYDIVIPENRFVPFKSNSFLSEQMPWEEVQQLCNTFNTDAVLSVDMFKTRVSTDYKKDDFYDPYRNGFSSAAVAKMMIIYRAYIRVYDPGIKKIISKESFRDTLFYEDVDIYTSELMKRFTPVKSALSEAGIAVALDYSDIICTTWRPETRSIYIKGGKEFEQAAILVSNDEWDSAMKTWRQISDSKNSKGKKSKAEYNLAVAYEIQGDLENAVRWGVKSYESSYRVLTYKYLELLQQRQFEQKKKQK